LRSTLLLVCSVVVGLLAWIPSPAAAAAEGATLSLTAPVGVSEGSAPVTVRFAWTGATRGYEAFFVVYPALSSRSELAATLREGPTDAPILITAPKPLARIAAGSGRFALTDGIFAALGCDASCDGVYPVELRIANDQTGVTRAQLLFGLPYLASATRPRLALAPIVRVAPSSSGIAMQRSLRALAALAAPYSIAFTGSETVPAARLQRLAGLVAGSSLHEHLLAPYVSVSPACARATSILGLSQRLALGRQVVGGAEENVLLGERPSRDELATLAAARAHVVVLSDRVLAQVAPVLSLSDPVRTGTRGLEFLGASPTLGDELAAAVTPAGMQRLIADLAQFYFQAPSQAGRVAVAEVMVARAASVGSLPSTLSMLAGLPFLRLVTVSQAASRPTLLIPSSGLALAGSHQSCAPLGGRLRTSLRRVSGLLAADDGSKAPLQDLVALAEVAAATRSRASATYLARATDRFASALNLVGSRTITLTAHSATIPLTLSSRLPFPARVRLAVVAPEFRFPSGGSRVVRLDRATVTVQLPVRVAVLGTFPATVEVLSPSGTLLREVRVTVHSTGFSSVGIGLTLASVLVLALWWARTIRSRRRRPEQS